LSVCCGKVVGRKILLMPPSNHIHPRIDGSMASPQEKIKRVFQEQKKDPPRYALARRGKLSRGRARRRLA
jgi:hypothetical protein